MHTYTSITGISGTGISWSIYKGGAARGIRRLCSPHHPFLGFPGGSDDKESACNAGDLGSIPGLGRSPGGGHGNPLQYSFLENPLDRDPGGLQPIASQRVRHLWAPKHSTDHPSLHSWGISSPAPPGGLASREGKIQGQGPGDSRWMLSSSSPATSLRAQDRHNPVSIKTSKNANFWLLQ